MSKMYALVFLGGGIGSAVRYWMSGIIPRYTGEQFPYGILVVNVLGCFAIGVLAFTLEERFVINPTLWIFLTVGVLGGFTTFSTFSYETMAMLRDGEFLRASLYVFLTLSLGFGGTYAGSLIGKLL